jgi:hypothetical protein
LMLVIFRNTGKTFTVTQRCRLGPQKMMAH